MTNSLLFLQKRSSKAGAQVALSRLLRHPQLQALNPVLVTEQDGWLTEQCRSHGLPVILQKFPASRSLLNRFLGNQRFAQEILRQAAEANLKPALVLGNDHGEGLLTRAVAKAARIASVIILRSSETTESFFHKYECDRCDLIYSVGEELTAKVKKWGAQGQIRLLNDGVYETEFHPVKPKAAAFPTNILVAGSAVPDKGWADFAVAIDLLEKDPNFPALDFDFTGTPPDPAINDMQLGKPRRARFNFRGRQEKFIEFVQRYDLVLHPSREESFGLAPVEILAAGVTLLSSSAGVMGQIQLQKDWLTIPASAEDLADKLRNLWQNWPHLDCEVSACQQNIRSRFLMDTVVADLVSELRRLLD